MAKRGTKGGKGGSVRRPPAARTAPVAAAPDTTATLRGLYLKGLGGVLLLAFLSLAVQLDGLIGPQGIDPWRPALDEIGAAHPAWTDRLLGWPTLAWLLPNDHAPGLLVALGLLGALGPLTGRLAAPGLLLAWASYLSLCTLGGRFLNFQWDALLCEATLLSILVAPWGLRPTRATPSVGWWAVRALLFKLVFLGGLAKLWSGDPTWRDLTALTYHFETQPLPNVLGGWAHALPVPLLMAGTLLNHVIELVLVFGVFGPRAARRVAFVGIDLLMILLALTGSYGFFQFLTLVLSLSLLDDEDLRMLRLPLRPPRPRPLPWAQGLAGVGLAAWVGASVLAAAPRYTGPLPEPAEQVRATLAPFRSANSYGLFAVMTTERPIPVLEARWGQDDWQELTWRWQTSDPLRAPAQVAPHMPRLDWQLWFAGLGPCDDNAWIVRLEDRVLAGSEPVARLIGDLRLLPGRQPTAVRLVLYRYRFARNGEPGWWVRERVGLYCPERESGLR